MESYTNLGLSRKMDNTDPFTEKSHENGHEGYTNGRLSGNTCCGETQFESFSSFVKKNNILEEKKANQTVPCKSFGEIKFNGFERNETSSLYIRIDKDTDPKLITKLLHNVWRLPHPNLLISITGGAQKLSIKPKYLERLKSGLLDAAISTEAWILTGGTEAGIMKVVGEAVHEYFTTRYNVNKPICIGIATWGIIHNREALVGKLIDGMFPATYSKHDMSSLKEKWTSMLDPHHTHFVLVDNGSNKYGGEIKFRADLEWIISEGLCEHQNTKRGKIPLIQILVEGGIGSMQAVYETVERKNAVLVLKGTGRAADFIAKGYEYTKSPNNDEDVKFSPKFDKDMKKEAENYFEFGKNNITEEDITQSVKQLRSILSKRNLISVFNAGITSAEVNLDEAILQALMKAKKSEVKEQLNLALAWNRSDIAKNEIFGKLQEKEVLLDDSMMVALEQGKHEFVQLFLNNGIKLETFLTKEKLCKLYKKCFDDKSDEAADFIKNLLPPSQDLSGEGENENNKWLGDVGKIIEKLMDNQAFNPYEYAFNKNLTDPEKDLFCWALLLNRNKMATLFWRIGKNHIGAALFAAALQNALAKKAEEDENLELATSYSESAESFETLASETLSHCYTQNRSLAQLLLIRKLKNYGGTTPFMLADSAELMNFTDQSCCQAKLNSVWKGMMSQHTRWWKICICMFLPVFVGTIKFITNIDPSKDLSEDFDNLEDEITKYSSQGGRHSGKVAPQKSDSAETKIYKRKLFSVKFFRSHSSISILSALYYYYTAPVTKFYFHIVAYLVYLALFTFFVLTDLYPIDHEGRDSPSIYEYVVWGWTATMILEEIRQILSREHITILNKLNGWIGNTWNKFDLVMYILFIMSVILRLVIKGQEFQYVRLIYSITVAFFYMRILQGFFVEKNIGPKVFMIQIMVKDLLFFCFIPLVFVFCFGTVYQANLFPNANLSWDLLSYVVYMPYWQIFGDPLLEYAQGLLPETCTYNESIWRTGAIEQCAEKLNYVPMIAAVYMLLTNLLLVNLLIAMFSDTYRKVQENSLKVWRFHKLSLVYEYYERPTFVPPLIIFNHAFRLVRYLASKMGCTNLKYHDNFKKLFKDKEDEVLNTFEKQAVESHLHEMDKKSKEELSYKVSGTAKRLDKVIKELERIKERQWTKRSEDDV